MAKSPVNDLLAVWLGIGMVFAVFIGTAAGVLAWLGGLTVAGAVLSGGGCFIAVLTLMISVLNLLYRRS
jgi:hypothetical protein